MLILSIVGDLFLLDRYRVYGFSKNSWVLVLLVTILLTVGCLVTCWKGIEGPRRPWLLVCLVTVGILVYSYFLLVFTNCYYDRSTPAESIVTVLGKRESHGKTTTYYINLSPWGYFRSLSLFMPVNGGYRDILSGRRIDLLFSYLKIKKWITMKALIKPAKKLITSFTGE